MPGLRIACAEASPPVKVTRDARLYLAVAVCAVVVYIGALWNRFALDDGPIVALNPLVQAPSGVWRAFVHPYWPASFGGQLYRPLAVATYALDALLDGPAWFHLVNLLWHAGASVGVAALARRWSGERSALVAGLLFAVHPVHVEAVANVAGRAELMAALFSMLAVYAALAWGSVGWSAAALALGMLSKENAVVVPALVIWGWLTGLARPGRRGALAFAISWALLGAAYVALRAAVLRHSTGFLELAPVFDGARSVPIRLTAVAAFTDVARLLVFPLTLRADYAPAERTLVTSLADGRLLLGLACLVAWATLLTWAWRRARMLEAFALGWIAIALLPVANLVVPVGVLIAERALYLPSAGLVIALATWLARVAPRRLWLVLGVLAASGALRTALRVPVWRNDNTVTLSILEDSPRSYRGPQYAAQILQGVRQPERALAYYRLAFSIYPRDSRLLIGAADAAFTLGRPGTADSLLRRAEELCRELCATSLRNQANAARARGDSVVAESLTAWARAP